MKRIGALSVSATVVIAFLAMSACRLPGLSAEAATRIEKVKDNFYIITGSDTAHLDSFSGGNTGVFITDAGVVLIDTKLPGWGDVLRDRIKTVTDKPVTMIINTHTNRDHTGSNSMFPPGLDILAHENTKTNMAGMDLFEGDNARFLPKRTFNDRLTIGSGKDEIDLYYFGRGRTDGDAWVVLPALGVMHTGDMFAVKDAPVVDHKHGGSALEYVATLENALATVKDVDTVITGHSPPRTIGDLREYRDFVIDFIAAVRQAKTAGKNVDDATAAIDLSPKYKDYTKLRYRPAIQGLYDEIQ